MNYFEQVKKHVDSLFVNKSASELIHFDRTVYWLKQLNPSADEASLIAAYSHDIERAFRLSESSGKKLTDEESLRHHQDEGARIIGDYLDSVNAPSQLVSKVQHLVSRHEWGGDGDQDFLCDADSLSFLETKIESFLGKVKSKGLDSIKEKFDWMYERMRTAKGKELAKPLYANAIKLLSNVNIGEIK